MEHVILANALLTLAFAGASDPITPGMRSVLERIDKVHAGMDQKTIDDAVEELHREFAKQDQKAVVEITVHHLMRLAPRDTQTRVLLRKALDKKWLDELSTRAMLVRAGDSPGPHIEVLTKALDAPKTRRAAIRVIGTLGEKGRSLLPTLKKIIDDAKADPGDFLRAFRSVEDVPDHVLAYWSVMQIEAALKKK